MKSGSAGNINRYSLGALLLLVAINAFGGGYYGMAGAKDVPLEWLEKSPFDSYFVPGLILFVLVGGSCLFASIVVFKGHRLARYSSFICVAIIFTWLLVQVAIIGYVSWMQPTTAILSLLILLLALFLPKEVNKKVVI